MEIDTILIPPRRAAMLEQGLWHENGAVTTTLLEDDDARSVQTDGYPLPGVEVRVVDIGGEPLPAGQVGKLLVRCCSNFGGYLQRPQLNGTDAHGWFDTGGLARIDAAGYIRICGRTRDVIIRGALPTTASGKIQKFKLREMLNQMPV